MTTNSKSTTIAQIVAARICDVSAGGQYCASLIVMTIYFDPDAPVQVKFYEKKSIKYF